MPSHQHPRPAKPRQDTSWQQVSPWYNKLVGSEGHFFHEQVVLPGVVRLLKLQPQDSLLDLGCGQGILAKKIPSIAKYVGWDKAPALIRDAQSTTKNPNSTFAVKDVTKVLPEPAATFSHAACILALQNMAEPRGALQNAANHLVTGGKLVLVLNHPCFRIPRQSGWGIDEKTKLQHRWVNRYMTPLEIPIAMHPGQKNAAVTWSFHHSLHDICALLTETGFGIAALEEWTSPKESVGTAAKMENRARSEFPLFLTILAEKNRT
ncbi:MAG: class I SAM-dependent methyltransferase [bacterium]|nr:class I SAM-dependent methyltransferase [bacterium]